MAATTQQNPPPESRFGPPPKGPWRNRVENRGPVAFRPGEFVVTGESGRDGIGRLLMERTRRDPKSAQIIEGYWLVYVENEDGGPAVDVAAIVAEGRAQGFDVEPNYVVFAHSAWGCGCGCGGGGGCGCHPFMGNPFMGNPFMGNPFMGNPFMGNPFMGNPFMGNPFMGNPFMGNPFMGNPFMGNSGGPQHSSAEPAKEPAKAEEQAFPKAKSRAVILDTGLATTAHLPALLRQYDGGTPTNDRDTPDELGDGFLDPAAGHGTFIAGILERLAPGQPVKVCAVLSTFGDGDVATIANRLDTLVDEGAFDGQTVLNMSLGAYADARMHLLETAIRKVQRTGAVVVASAGNDATCLPSFPAALPDVVGVGSVEGCGRAPYSNFGPWVRACAPGSEVVSAFYRNFNGKRDPIGGQVDPDEFASWARWTGTSFAAPIVAAALMRHMALLNTTANEAVAAVIDNPALLRYPCLGTVVNLVPGM